MEHAFSIGPKYDTPERPAEHATLQAQPRLDQLLFHGHKIAAGTPNTPAVRSLLTKLVPTLLKVADLQRDLLGI